MSTTNEQPSDLNDIECWREARDFVNLIYDLTRNEGITSDSILTDFLRRNALSIMSKISAGYHRRQSLLFEQCLEEAKGNLGEVISSMYIAFDQEFISREELNDILNKGYTVGIKINSYLKFLQKQLDQAE